MAGGVEMFKADFVSLEDVSELGERAIAFLGGVDVLINNSGICLIAVSRVEAGMVPPAVSRQHPRAVFFRI